MSKRFMDPKGKLIVAVNFNGMATQLVELARAMSTRTGLGLRLVHVVEPTLRDVYPGSIDVTGALRDAADEIDEQNLARAKEQLFQMERDLLGDRPPSASPVERCVLMGQPAEALMADATLNHAALILCGAMATPLPITPTGMSTALTLMSQAPCPVMVTTPQCSHNLSSGPIRMIIADDLYPSSLSAVVTGLDLARALGQSEVLHLTVSSLTQGWIRETLETLRQKAGGAPRPEGGLEAAFVSHRTNLEERLRQRAPEHVSLLATKNGSYKTAVVQGRNIAEDIRQAAKDFGAALVIYGRHQTLHRTPLALGKIPWHQMLQGDRLIMVAPSPES